MQNSTKISDAAVQELLDASQKLADAEKAMVPKREAAQKHLNQLVDEFAEMDVFDESKVSTEMIAAYLIFQGEIAKKMRAGDMSVQMSMGKFSEDLLQGFGKYMITIQGDKEKMNIVQQAGDDLTKDFQKPKIIAGMPLIEVAISAPEGDHGKWTFAVVPVIMDKNYKVKLVDTLDFDLSLTMKIMPVEGLSGEFNAPSIYMKEGEKIQHLAVSAETTESGPAKYLMITGEAYKNGQLIQTLPFSPAMPLAKQDPNAVLMPAVAPGSHGLH